MSTERSPALDALRRDLLAGPSLFVQKLDIPAERALLLRLDAETFQSASFLDDRILGANAQGMWVRFGHLDTALAGAAPQRDLHFIFHIGHVGSTLLSRLTQHFPGVLALREPLPLQALASAHDTTETPRSLLTAPALDHLIEQQVLLWRRGFDDTRCVTVKATSATARLAPALMRAAPQARALYLFLAREQFLAALLAGANSAVDLRGHAVERSLRLERLTGLTLERPLHALSLGELTAMAWATEMLTLAHTQRTLGARVLAMDFDLFLADPVARLSHVCAHFDLAAAPADVEAAIKSDVMQRYAKGVEHAYSKQVRDTLLAQARAAHADEIKKGLAWIDAFARAYPAFDPDKISSPTNAE